MSVANVLALLTLLAVVIGGMWAMYISICKKIDNLDQTHDGKIKRVYQRQDEEIKDVMDSQKSAVEKIEKEFMRVDAHNLSMEHIKEVMEIKSNATVQLFTSQLADLTRRIAEVIERLNNKEKNAQS